MESGEILWWLSKFLALSKLELMINIIRKLTYTAIPSAFFDIVILLFRVLLSIQMIYAHGLKKIGIGVLEAEQVPNPLHLPEMINSVFAIAANIFFPILVILGLFTRLAILPIVAVTLTGYFILHLHDAALIKDAPFMYSLSYLLILYFGAGRFSLDYYIHLMVKK